MGTLEAVLWAVMVAASLFGYGFHLGVGMRRRFGRARKLIIWARRQSRYVVYLRPAARADIRVVR